MGKIRRRAADNIHEMWQAHKARKPGGAGFGPVGPLFHVAKTTTTHEAEATEDVDLYNGPKGEEVHTGQTVKAYNRRGANIAEGEWIHIQWVGDGWEILGGGGGVTLIGPCGTYTPEEAEPDTDFETAFPGGCNGPDKYGIRFVDPSTNLFVEAEPVVLVSTGPLVFESDTFSLTCGSSTTVYLRVTVNSLDTDGVVGEILRASDDLLIQGYVNSLYSLIPLAGGNLQLGPSGPGDCDCLVPYDLCLAIPSR